MQNSGEKRIIYFFWKCHSGKMSRMSVPSQTEITRYLLAWNEGDQAALQKLMPVVYDELRKLARSYLRKERTGHTLQATALVHEAFLRLIDQNSVQWQNRAHFFGVAAQMMRRILTNYAIARGAEKRGGKSQHISLEDVTGLSEHRDLDVVSLDQALNDLEALDPRQSRIVEMRFFSGLSIEETAEVMQLSPATIKREWSTARLWLRRKMAEQK
jgi:RNA polymerase sigma factor (TIGR02999 family)